MTLVSAIIPAYNAERTIGATLASVRGQTHRELEIIVVDDGSSDGTREIVEKHATADDRIRLVVQANGGVASARNRGIAESSGRYIAPVDADDLWHPEKISRQLQAIEQDRQVGLVCTAYSVLDEHNMITMQYGGAVPRHHQFLDLCRRNFIGNGSSALLRREAVERYGGYDETLRARRAQGCEDLKLYLSIAEEWAIKLLPEPLTGYRETSDNMSSDADQMIRSFDIVAAEFCRRRADLRSRFNAHRTFMICWLAHRKARAGQWSEVIRLSSQLFTRPSLGLPEAIVGATTRRIGRIPSLFQVDSEAPKRTFTEAAIIDGAPPEPMRRPKKSRA